jgi:single-stranded DNA-specific DHH superfamily exonuclease
MDSHLWEIAAILEPYGQENDSLKLFIKGALIEDMYQVGGGENKYLRMTLRYGAHAWSAMWWDCPDKSLFKKGMKVNLVFSPEYNYWKGQMKEQMIIHEMEVSEEDSHN